LGLGVDPGAWCWVVSGDPGLAVAFVVVFDVDAEGAGALGSVEAGLGTCSAGSGGCAVLLCELGLRGNGAKVAKNSATNED
jgi:hypothetical protein